MRRLIIAACFAGAASLFMLSGGIARALAGEFIVLASTTSTEQSGLFAYLLPRFTAATGIEVRVVAQGTGQALASARRGDADVVLVHDRAAEQAFVDDGYALARDDVMYNDFVLIGPAADPAGIRGGSDVLAAMRALAGAQALFISRGDRSGTHAAEMRFWRAAGVDPVASGRARWYREAGAGMGPTLNIASALDAYTMTDRATWLRFGNRGRLEILVQGDPRLFNQYGVMAVNPARHPHVRAAAAKRFASWIVTEPAQRAIAEFRIDGQAPFFPNAGRGALSDRRAAPSRVPQ